jgi:hypothetical protein
MITALIAAALFHPVQEPAPVELFRSFTKGDKLTYQVKSHLMTETKQIGNPVYMPGETDLDYNFTIDVKDTKNEGFAEIVYKRPTMQISVDQGGTSQDSVEDKVNMNFGMTLSPVNEITDLKDLNPPEKPKTGGGTLFMRRLSAAGVDAAQIPFLGDFVQDLYRLALCTGSLDSALDLAPKLPYEEVKKGDTWKRTVSYQPQKLKGKDGKTVVQRLDYTFTYDGLVAKDNVNYHQITATLKLDTDIGTFINQYFNATAGQTGIKAIPFQLQSKIVYLLDEKTKNTVRADAEATGAWRIQITQTETAVYDEKLTGKTTLKLLPKK